MSVASPHTFTVDGQEVGVAHEVKAPENQLYRVYWIHTPLPIKLANVENVKMTYKQDYMCTFTRFLRINKPTAFGQW